jgi:uncharacterized protein YggE
MRRVWARRLGFAMAAAALLAAGGTLVAQTAGARSNVGAPVKTSTTGHTITVSGDGAATVTPDMATITLGVETKGGDAQAALHSNATKMTAVIAAIKAQGVPDNKIQTSNLSLYQDSQSDIYVADNNVTVEVDAINNVGQVIDAAVDAGANNSWGISFGLKDQSGARAQALQAAVADARKHADAIATGLGVSVSGVGSASEVSYDNPIRFGAAPAPGAVGVSTPVQAGELQITATVQVVYTFG